jgi:hypothetical protein
MEELRSSETSDLTRVTRHNIPEDGILHSHRREPLKSYMCKDAFYLKNPAKEFWYPKPVYKVLYLTNHNEYVFILKLQSPMLSEF